MNNVIHIDMDAFFASIEQQVNPALRGKPVIIGGRNNKYRSIICAASYEAKALGVTNAMPSWKALQICPKAIFVPADTPKYVDTSNRIHEILKTYSPQIEKFSVDEFFIGVDGCRKLRGSPEEMGQRIKDQIKQTFGITCSVGIAPTRVISKLAAKLKKPDGLATLDKAGAIKVLQHLPVDKICGIGRRLKRRFNLLGIETCGQLANYPDHILREHFGVIGLWLKRTVRVEDVSDIEYFEYIDEPPKSVGHSQTLREQSTDEEFIRGWIYLLSEMVAQRLRRKKIQGRTVHFYVSDGFGGGFSRQRTYVEHTYDGYTIYQRCLDIIASFRFEYLCARVLGVSVSHLSKENNLYLFDDKQKRERVMKAADDINDQYGEWTIFPAALKQAQY